MALYEHQSHAHVPRNPNTVHREKQEAKGFNARLAVYITTHTGTMWCAYVFFGIGIGSLVGVLTNNAILAGVFGSVSSYILQLVLLPIILDGQNIQGERQEVLAQETYETTMHNFHDTEQLILHLNAQDEELLRQTALLVRLASTLPGAPPAPEVAAPTASTAPPKRSHHKQKAPTA